MRPALCSTGVAAVVTSVLVLSGCSGDVSAADVSATPTPTTSPTPDPDAPGTYGNPLALGQAAVVPGVDELEYSVRVGAADYAAGDTESLAALDPEPVPDGHTRVEVPVSVSVMGGDPLGNQVGDDLRMVFVAADMRTFEEASVLHTGDLSGLTLGNYESESGTVSFIVPQDAVGDGGVLGVLYAQADVATVQYFALS